MKTNPSLLSIAFIIFSLLLLTAFQPSPTPSEQSGTINLTIDVAADRKPVSPYIYGLNFAKESFADEIDLPIRRWGGNSTSRYNWKIANLNTGNDWYFENISSSNAYNWNLPEDHNDWVEQNTRTGTASLITIPILGYVAKNDSSCGFSVVKYGTQTGTDVWRPDCGNGSNLGGYITGNDPLDTSLAIDSAFMQDWVVDLVDTHGAAANGGVRFYALDNEPELWSETHRDVHPTHQTYEELFAKSREYGEAVKAADPDAQLLGYVAFGWSGYWYSRFDLEAAAQNGYTHFPDYESHGNLHQVEWYLAQMRQYEVAHDLRLLDYLDLHYYPESGVALTTVGDSAMKTKRLRSTRSLWDPNYIDESWIGGTDQEHRVVRLIPRMRDWTDVHYPGTKLAITEYNFGGLEDINGALAQADVLGIFGREGIDLATLWNYPNPSYDPLGYINFETLPGAFAFRMYRNYDGNGRKFGDVSVKAFSEDQGMLSVYATQRTSDSALTVIVINKASNAISSFVSLANFTHAGIAQVYRYDSTNLDAIVRKEDIQVSHSGFSTSFPANSISLLVLPDRSRVTAVTKIFKSNTTQDGWVLETTETSNKGGKVNSGSATINIGDDAANRQYRAILSFNTTLPTGAVVTNATLKFKYSGKTGTLPFSTHGKLLVDVKKGAFSNNPALTKGDFNASASKSGLFSLGKSTGWFNKVFTVSQLSYINTSGVTQFRLRFAKDDNNDLGADLLKIHSGSAGNNVPQLIVEYYVP
jgi:hypothetical protein